MSKEESNRLRLQNGRASLILVLSSFLLLQAWQPLSSVAQDRGSLGVPRADLRKGAIENPSKRISSSELSSLLPRPDNTKVQPGKIQWREDFASAVAASKRSGKPVLLFQMMGKLDDAFC